MTARPLAALALALALAACRSLPLPRAGAQPSRGDDGYEAPQEVPNAPPPGKVKIVPERPAQLKNPVWIDGQWEWKDMRWQWTEGGWEDQADGMYYAQGVLRLDGGTLVYERGRWTKYPAKE
jgi:hypothetical protein